MASAETKAGEGIVSEGGDASTKVKGKLRAVAELEGHVDIVWHVSWHPTKSMLASCGSDKSIRLWSQNAKAESESKSWSCVAVLEEASDRTVRRVEWSPCGSMLAAVSFDGTTVIWQRVTDDAMGGVWEVAATLEGHDNEVKGVAWHPSGSMLATCSRDRSVWVWEADDDEVFECSSVLHGHSQDVKCVTWHPDGTSLLSCSYDDTIRVWNEADGDFACTGILKGHESTVWEASFEAGGNRFVSASDDKNLIVWRSARGTDSRVTWQRCATITGHHTRTIFSVDWDKRSKAGGRIATGAQDDAIRVFKEAAPDSGVDGEDFSFVLVDEVPKAHAGDVNCVRWCPTRDNYLASAGDDSVVRVWVLE